MFKSAELPWLITFFQMFYNDKPVDWLLEHLIYTKVCNWEKDTVSYERRKPPGKFKFMQILRSFAETLQIREGEALAALQALAVPAHRHDVIAEGKGSEAKGPAVRQNTRLSPAQEQPAGRRAHSNPKLQDPHTQQGIQRWLVLLGPPASGRGLLGIYFQSADGGEKVRHRCRYKRPLITK